MKENVEAFLYKFSSKRKVKFFENSLLQVVMLVILHANVINSYNFTNYVNYLHNFSWLYTIVYNWYKIAFTMFIITDTIQVHTITNEIIPVQSGGKLS